MKFLSILALSILALSVSLSAVAAKVPGGIPKDLRPDLLASWTDRLNNKAARKVLDALLVEFQTSPNPALIYLNDESGDRLIQVLNFVSVHSPNSAIRNLARLNLEEIKKSAWPYFANLNPSGTLWVPRLSVKALKIFYSAGFSTPNEVESLAWLLRDLSLRPSLQSDLVQILKFLPELLSVSLVPVPLDYADWTHDSLWQVRVSEIERQSNYLLRTLSVLATASPGSKVQIAAAKTAEEIRKYLTGVVQYHYPFSTKSAQFTKYAVTLASRLETKRKQDQRDIKGQVLALGLSPTDVEKVSSLVDASVEACKNLLK